MNLSFSAQDEAFRADVRTFLDRALTPEMRDNRGIGSVSRDVTRAWHRALYAQGWVAPSWPVDEGGTDWTPNQKYVFAEETARAGAPGLPPFGLGMVGPVIYSFGTPEQKAKHLPGILSGDVSWCQGYSEPGSGSDLASLKTRAVRDGDEYVVNGQKIWTSSAHEADWIFCLVRTSEDGKPQTGISFLLIDMKTPGIEVKPIISIDGRHHLNETFFTDVRVPVGNRIGEENRGWTYAKYLLGHERTGIAGVPGSWRAIDQLRGLSADIGTGDGDALQDDADFRRELDATEVRLTALDMTNQRILAAISAGKDPGAASSMLKIVGTEIQQALQERTVEALGLYGLPFQAGVSDGQGPVGPDAGAHAFASFAFGRAATIYGGSNEIQRNVIAKAVLGL